MLRSPHQNTHILGTKYLETESHVPLFLNRATCQKIYEAGLSTQLLRLVNRSARIECAVQSRPISNLLPPDISSPEQTNTQEWWAGFQSNLNQWAEESHTAITRELMAQLYSKVVKKSTTISCTVHICVLYA